MLKSYLPVLGAIAALCAVARAADAPATPAAKPKDYELQVSCDPNHIHPGDAAKATVVIKPHAPWGLKTTTPFELHATGSAGLEIKQATLGRKDFTDPKATDKSLVVPVEGKQVGAQTLSLGLNFFLCTDEVCQRYKETMVLPVVVE